MPSASAALFHSQPAPLILLLLAAISLHAAAAARAGGGASSRSSMPIAAQGGDEAPRCRFLHRVGDAQLLSHEDASTATLLAAV